MQLAFKAAGSYLELQRKLTEQLESQIPNLELGHLDATRMVGLLFARPSSKLSKEEVIPHIPYFHERSAEFINFYCIGYSDHRRGEEDEELVLELEGKEWTFSNARFNRMRTWLQDHSKWESDGPVDLILANARIRTVVVMPFGINGTGTPTENLQKAAALPEADLDLSSAICANLAEMREIGAITSVEAFLRGVIRSAKKSSSLEAYSDGQGAKIVKTALIDLILALLPKGLRNNVKKAPHFAVRNISKVPDFPPPILP